MDIPLEKLVIAGTDSPISLRHIIAYMLAMERGGDGAPPITVRPITVRPIAAGLWQITDGKHRYVSAVITRRKFLRATVGDGPARGDCDVSQISGFTD